MQFVNRMMPSRQWPVRRSGARLPRLGLALTLLTVGLAAPAVAQFTPFEGAVARFDAEVARGVADDAAGCVSVAVFIGDEVVWTKGYGWADIERRIACTEHTIGRVGSISKSFTAVAMMQLAERGILALDQPVVDVFPEFSGLTDAPEGSNPVTFRMLASHTAGLIREPGLEGAAAGSIYRWEDQILASIPTTSFQSSPGSAYSYSNIGFGILGLASSRAAGVPFTDLVTEQIFRPLGMQSSTFVVNEPDLAARLSIGYARRRSDATVSAEQATREHFGRGYKVPNGGIYSTVGDLALFAAALMGESSVEILTPESREEILRPQAPAPGYGLGFTVRQDGDSHVVGHGGSVAGYNASLLFDLRTGIGVAMLRTTGYNPPVTELLDELLGSPDGALSDVGRRAEAERYLARTNVRREIQRLNREMEAALGRGDLAAVAAFYADDALLIGPGTTAQGRAAVDAYWGDLRDPVSWRLETFDITGSDEIVHQEGRSYLTTLRNGQPGVSVVDFLLVWRKQEDGTYRIVVDSYHDAEIDRR